MRWIKERWLPLLALVLFLGVMFRDYAEHAACRESCPEGTAPRYRGVLALDRCACEVR